MSGLFGANQRIFRVVPPEDGAPSEDSRPNQRMESAMTTFSQTRTASLLAQMVNAVTGSLVVRARQLALIVKNRRDATMLAGLDDRMLADIGLTRGDLRDA